MHTGLYIFLFLVSITPTTTVKIEYEANQLKRIYNAKALFEKSLEVPYAPEIHRTSGFDTSEKPVFRLRYGKETQRKFDVNENKGKVWAMYSLNPLYIYDTLRMDLYVAGDFTITLQTNITSTNIDAAPLIIKSDIEGHNLKFTNFHSGDYSEEEIRKCPFVKGDVISLRVQFNDDHFKIILGNSWHKNYDYRSSFNTNQRLIVEGNITIIYIELLENITGELPTS
ncbi:unnamed protein product [Caenorhabditis bovis]|uniref:Galectin n=1 Tax=Caenorhabditis bovis TaxID=2654633 RepID=A0A8S1E8K1_9PELO|nr:unnamed protein product [Caenorhabditis bovis]